MRGKWQYSGGSGTQPPSLRFVHRQTSWTAWGWRIEWGLGVISGDSGSVGEEWTGKCATCGVVVGILLGRGGSDRTALGRHPTTLPPTRTHADELAGMGAENWVGA
jgi:hypothetical protein